MYHEQQMHADSWFLTLTYDDESIPENGSLDARDTKRFIDRLRAGRPAGSVSYFVCGEYGEVTQRPHYHVAVFGPDFRDREVHRQDDAGHRYWRSDEIERCWELGHSEFSTLGFGSAAYIGAYVTKKVHRTTNPDHYTRVDPRSGELVELQPEFARMSLKPAVGRRWIEEYWREVYPRDYVVVDGKRSRPPRYYDKFMDLADEKGGCAERRELMFKVREKRADEFEFMREGRLEAMEKIHESRRRLFQDRGAI